MESWNKEFHRFTNLKQFKHHVIIITSIYKKWKKTSENQQEALDDLLTYMKNTVDYQNYDSISDMADVSNIHQKYSNPHLTNRNGDSFRGFYNEISWMHLSENGIKSVNNLYRAWTIWARIVKYR